MRIEQKAQNFIASLGEQFRPKTREERQIKAFWAAVVMLGVLLVWGYYLYTT